MAPEDWVIYDDPPDDWDDGSRDTFDGLGISLVSPSRVLHSGEGYNPSGYYTLCGLKGIRAFMPTQEQIDAWEEDSEANPIPYPPDQWGNHGWFDAVEGARACRRCIGTVEFFRRAHNNWIGQPPNSTKAEDYDG